MFITLVSVITAFVIQLERKKLKKIENENVKLKRHLGKALNNIEGYHAIEEALSNREDIEVRIYRRQIREDLNVQDYTFLSPSKVKEYKEDLV